MYACVLSITINDERKNTIGGLFQVHCGCRGGKGGELLIPNNLIFHSQSVSTNKLSVSYVKRNRLISVEEKIKSHSSPPLHRIIILLPPAAMVLNEWKLPIHTHTSLLPQSVSHCGAYHWRLLLLFQFPNRTVERWRKIIIILRR